jgi:hypothetical protein
VTRARVRLPAAEYGPAEELEVTVDVVVAERSGQSHCASTEARIFACLSGRWTYSSAISSRVLFEPIERWYAYKLSVITSSKTFASQPAAS